MFRLMARFSTDEIDADGEPYHLFDWGGSRESGIEEAWKKIKSGDIDDNGEVSHVWAEKAGPYIVAYYEQDKVYGGPEEGGWYYNTGHLIRLQGIYKNRRKAVNVANKLNEKLLAMYRRERRLSPSSSIYGGGWVLAEMYEGEAPRNYPKHRPHYE